MIMYQFLHQSNDSVIPEMEAAFAYDVPTSVMGDPARSLGPMITSRRADRFA